MQNWQKLIEKMDGPYAPSTLRAYRADFEGFSGWCTERDRSALPAAPETVAAYVDERDRVRKASTIKRHMAAVQRVHRLAGQPVPTEDEEVNFAMRRVRRKRPGPPTQAFGITA